VEDIGSTHSLSLLDISFLLVYALICLLIGLIGYKKKDAATFMIGNRKLKTPGFVFSVLASYIGGAAVVAYTAYVYRFGPAAIAVFGGTAIGFLVFVPYALRIKKSAKSKQFLTLSDWIRHQNGNKAGLISSLILFVVYFGMLLNQFIAGSSILASISGWSYETALSISAFVIVIYLSAGGFNSVIRTDIFQYFVLLGLMILLLFYMPEHSLSNVFQKGAFEKLSPFLLIAFMAFGVFIVFQSAEYWQRVYAAESTKVVKNGLIWSAILVLISGVVISFVGLNAHFAAADIEPRNAFAHGLSLLMPEQFLSLGLVLIFAAIMSSADTIIFVLASSLSVDFIKKYRNREANKSMASTTRWFIILLSLAAFVFAWFFRDLIQVIVFITGMGFSIIPAVIIGFHYKIRSESAIISFCTGIIYIFILLLTGTLYAEASIASIVVSFISLLLSQFWFYLKARK